MAGTVTVTISWMSYDRKELEIKLACIGDSGDGTVPDTDIFLGLSDKEYTGRFRQYTAFGYKLYEVWTVAGSPAPDAADITITDEIGAVMYDENGVIAASGTTEGTVDKYRLVTSNLTVSVQNQATVSAAWDIYLKLIK